MKNIFLNVSIKEVKKEGSTGLGLAIADSICRLQHLNIRYYFEQEEHCFEILK